MAGETQTIFQIQVNVGGQECPPQMTGRLEVNGGQECRPHINAAIRMIDASHHAF